MSHVSGPGLFGDLNSKDPRDQTATREFFGEAHKSKAKALEDAAQMTFSLLDNKASNEVRGRLPPYDFSTTKLVQGRRSPSESSVDSSDHGSSGEDQPIARAVVECTCRRTELTRDGRCRCGRKLYQA